MVDSESEFSDCGLGNETLPPKNMLDQATPRETGIICNDFTRPLATAMRVSHRRLVLVSTRPSPWTLCNTEVPMGRDASAE